MSQQKNKIGTYTLFVAYLDAFFHNYEEDYIGISNISINTNTYYQVGISDGQTILIIRKI